MNLRTLAFSSALSLVAFSASAQVVTPGLLVINPAPGTSFAPGASEDSNHVQLFFEGWTTLADDLTVLAPNSFTTTTIAAGTTVGSYFFHFDPVGSSSASAGGGGTVTFSPSQLIVGLITSDNGLDATDGPGGFYPLGRSDLVYPSGTFARGLDSPDFAISFNSLQLGTGLFTTGAQIDQFRVLVIPEPTTYAAAMGALVFLIVGIRRFRESRRKLAA